MPSCRRIALIIMLALGIATFAAADRPVENKPLLPEQTPHLVILSARPDPDNVFLHVKGRNFCAAPAVTFGAIPLLVVPGGTNTSFDAILPADIPAGIYRLDVSCGHGAVRNDSFIIVMPPLE